jgi:hypothetical protein
MGDTIKTGHIAIPLGEDCSVGKLKDFSIDLDGSNYQITLVFVLNQKDTTGNEIIFVNETGTDQKVPAGNSYCAVAKKGSLGTTIPVGIDFKYDGSEVNMNVAIKTLGVKVNHIK